MTMASDGRDPLALHYEYGQLSLTDLLRARDTYHFHLLNKPNVVGTAVGYYLIRTDESRGEGAGSATTPNGRKAVRRKYPVRTFHNSTVRDDSWPCVLVLVSRWTDEERFSAGRDYDPTQMVPKTLYLPDGQAVPVCVVQVDEVPAAEAERVAAAGVPPAWKLGGGLPITVSCQGVEHIATAGCLVTDGHYKYALTAAHVCGDLGTSVMSRLRGHELDVGESSGKQLTLVEFSTAYPEFPGRRTLSAVDAGLIRLTDVNDWTSNIYGLPALGPLEDVHEYNLSLRLIDRQVVGYGAASGLLRGRIKALFYRYKSVGGFDYIGDFLISPDGDTGTRHGDSGMIWNLDVTQDPKDGPLVPLQERDLRPLAMQWGGQVFAGGGKRSGFAVATNLSTVCRLLEVDLVNDVSRGVSGYWGRVGHYSIASFAAQLVRDRKLRKLLTPNLHLLSFELDVVKGGSSLEKLLAEKGKMDAFVPLADVPDEVWKKRPPPAKRARTGGRDNRATPFGSNGPEHPNHYADIDDPYPPTGMTWREQCLKDARKISAQAWQRYYADIASHCADNDENDLARQYRDKLHQGLLPLRVWQVFDAMVDFLADQDIVGFLAAAGICAHYVGDASQPLHGSILADGDPRQLVERRNDRDEPAKFGEGVHSAYESRMVTRKANELVELVTDKLPGDHGLRMCRDGKSAARATLELMDRVAGILPPRTILESYERHLDGDRAHVSTLEGMWQDLGARTADLMVCGACTLAMIWDAAWRLGKGAIVSLNDGVALDQDAVRRRYIDERFLPSLTLDRIEPQLQRT